MSIIHNIKYKRPLDISKIEKFVSTIEGAVCENRGKDFFYFWIDGKSCKGFDITLEQGYIEVRNTALSNKYDYNLTNKIVSEILTLTNGTIFNEDEEPVFNFPIFDDERINKTEISDCEVIKVLSREHEDIAIYGPVRKVHFGNRLYEQFKELKGKELKDSIFNVILTVNYKIPNFGYGNTMQAGNSKDDKKIIKLLTNKANCIIDKYDYIMFQNIDEQPIVISNKILNTMLPSNWELVDEFTVVAPMTNDNEWNMLLMNAKKFDLWNKFVKK